MIITGFIIIALIIVYLVHFLSHQLSKANNIHQQHQPESINHLPPPIGNTVWFTNNSNIKNDSVYDALRLARDLLISQELNISGSDQPAAIRHVLSSLNKAINNYPEPNDAEHN